MQTCCEITLLRRSALSGGGRYFDEDFEAAGQRCFKCGGQGHIARDCPNEARPRPCYLCAQLGHTRAQCTNGARHYPVVPASIWTPAAMKQDVPERWMKVLATAVHAQRAVRMKQLAPVHAEDFPCWFARHAVG